MNNLMFVPSMNSELTLNHYAWLNLSTFNVSILT
eukprot:gene4861-5778_t